MTDQRPHADVHADGRASDGTDRPGPRDRAGAIVAQVRASLTLADVGALAVLTAATIHLVARDGGRVPRESLAALIVVALGTLALLPGLRRRSHPLLLLLTAWALAPLAAVALAEIRSGMARPLVVAAFVPAVALATIHLWRRPWGPRAIGAIVLVAALRSWYGTFLAWWGGSTGRPTWLALSWHNQSGTLMGALGVAAAAVAAVLRGRTRVSLLVLAGACLAGAWLSGSRGAVVATLLGIAALGLGLVRMRLPWRDLAATFGVLAVLTTGGVVALEAMVGTEVGQPLTSRDQSAGGNLIARIGHWEAAVGMAASRPVTGWGPGSYRWASLDHYPTDTNLTASAHNEYVEVLGESGLLGAAPVWFAAVAVAWFAGLVLWRRRTPAPFETAVVPRRTLERHAGALAAASVAVVLGLHAAIDFDWDYPVLTVLLAIAGAIVWAQRPTPATERPSRVGPRATLALSVLTAVAVLAGLAAGIAAAGIRPSPTPWDLDGRLSAAVSAAADGDIAAARDALDDARTWNPGASSLPVVTTVVDHHAGEANDTELAVAVGPDHASSSDRLLIAQRLFEVGALDAADRTLRELATTLEERRAWGGRQPATRLAGLRLAVAAADGGCDAAEALLPEITAWAESFSIELAEVAAVFDDAAAPSGCALTSLRAG